MPNMEDVLIRFGQHVLQLRRQRGWSQEEFAAKAGFHPSYVGGIERGERNLSLKAIVRLAAALECPAVDLLAFPQEEHVKHRVTKRAVKSLIIGDDARLEQFFSAFCESCEHLKSCLDLDGTTDAFSFASICCKHCQPLRKFKRFSEQQSKT